MAMKKGQLSIDLMFAVLIAVLFLMVFSIYTDNLSASTQNATNQNKAKAVLLDYYAAVGSVNAYEITAQYKAPGSGCWITMTNNRITVDYGTGEEASYSGLDLGGLEIQEEDRTPIDASSGFSCDKIITIVKV